MLFRLLWLLQLMTQQYEVWLTQRPQQGIWAGLYCLPVFENFEALQAIVPASYRAKLCESTSFKHVLTHKDLHCHVVKLELGQAPQTADPGAWWASKDWEVLGLPQPIRHLLSNSL